VLGSTSGAVLNIDSCSDLPVFFASFEIMISVIYETFLLPQWRKFVEHVLASVEDSFVFLDV